MAETSRVNREIYARFCGRLEVKFLRPTRLYFARKAAGFLSRILIYPILTDKFQENIWELATSTQRLNPNVLVDLELRAQAKDFIERPIGGPRKFKYLKRNGL